MIRAFVIILLCLLTVHAHAQYGSRFGRFEVDQVRGCAPLTVNVTVIAPFVCDAANPCDMDFEGNGGFQSLTFTYTYTQPGNYLLTVLFQTTGVDDIPIEVLPNLQPEFDLYTCGNNEVSVKLNDSNYDEYVINFNDGSPEVPVSGTGTANHIYAPGTQTVAVRGRNTGAADYCSSAAQMVTPLMTLPAPTITRLEVLDDSRIRLEFDGQPNIQYRLSIATNNSTTFQQAKTLYNVTVDTMLNLRTDDNYYCFRLAAYDPCNNVFVNSAVICSSNFDVSARNNAIDATWVTSTTGITGYNLRRDAGDGSTLTASPAGSPYVDTGIICGMDYCYQLTTQYANGSESISMQKCATGFSTDTPTPINNVSAIVGSAEVGLEWVTDPAFTPAEFTVRKSTGGAYAFLSNTTQTNYVDLEYNTTVPTCYRISYRDVCDNQSLQGIDVCPIQLSASLLSNNSVSLSWSAYGGWENGVAGYIVEKYSEDGTLLQTYSVGTATTYIDTSIDPDHQAFVYVVRATPVDNGLQQSVSNRVPVLKDPNLFHPTAFTPNGDNLNDIFNVFGQYVVAFEMQIFNRWGEMLFSTTDINEGWDGTYKGNEMPEGTYTFIAKITDRTGRTFKRSGSVLLLRKGH
jgi:gliding motility-associated-like protein